MNRLIISPEIETGIKNLPTGQSLDSDGFKGKFYQKFREELSHSNSSKKLQKKEHFQNHSTRPPSSGYQNPNPQ